MDRVKTVVAPKLLYVEIARVAVAAVDLDREIVGGKPMIVGVFKVKIKDYGITGLYIGDKIANEAEISVNCKYE